MLAAHKIRLEDYLEKYQNKEEYWRIQEELQPIFRASSPWAIEHYLSKGYSEAEGRAKIAERRANIKKCSTNPYQKEHWIKKGMSESEASVKIVEYKSSTSQQPTEAFCIRRYGKELGIQKFQTFKINFKARHAKMIENLMNGGHSLHEAKLLRSLSKSGIRRVPIDVWVNFKKYRTAVDYLTKLTMLSIGEDAFSREDIDNKSLQLDHKFSCYGGWVNKISPFIIASVYNLQFISRIENCKKGQYCSITKEQLLEIYNKNPLGELREDNEVYKLINEFINE